MTSNYYYNVWHSLYLELDLQIENKKYKLGAGRDIRGGKLKERKNSSKFALRFDDNDENENIIWILVYLG